jgi:hypothetical protein
MADWRIPSDGDDVNPFVILATADLPNPPMTQQEKRDELTATHRLIQAKYDAGTPFFTRSLFRDVVRQLETIQQREERTVSIPGLDGLTVQFPVETGNEYQYFQPGEDRICIM